MVRHVVIDSSARRPISFMLFNHCSGGVLFFVLYCQTLLYCQNNIYYCLWMAASVTAVTMSPVTIRRPYSITR